MSNIAENCSNYLLVNFNQFLARYKPFAIGHIYLLKVQLNLLLQVDNNTDYVLLPTKNQ
jgi:hypothetical protein